MDRSPLTALAEEWSALTAEAVRIRERKSEMRDVLEIEFSAIIPELNKELQGAGIGYYFEIMQYAGYMIDRNLSFALYPHTTDEWRAKDKHQGWVDYRRAKELEKFVKGSQAVKSFIAIFPHVLINIETNASSVESFSSIYCG